MTDLTDGDRVRLRSPNPQKFAFTEPAGPWRIIAITSDGAGNGRDVVTLEREGEQVDCWRTDIEHWRQK